MTSKIEQCEALVNKLENEIIEWDALKKLCRRDEELAEIENLLEDFEKEVAEEQEVMETHLQKKTEMLENKPDDTKAVKLIKRINEYMEELEKLEKDVMFLQSEQKDCFGMFDEEVPSPVKEVRNQRIANRFKNQKNMPPLQSTESDKPTDMYYMLAVNCKYRQRIQDMLKNLRMINQLRRELEEKYGGLKADLNAHTGRKAYVAVKGDAVDELWAYHINKAHLDLAVVRIGPGKYLFGTRNIMCKIINGKLVVRVGGGYMSADEFIS